MPKNNWIKKAINPNNKGVLRAYIKRTMGKDGFTHRGTIKVSTLLYIKKNDQSLKRRRQANLALNLKKR
jgi:hypothetical protein